MDSEKAYRYFFTPLALSDIDDAISYIAEKLYNPQAAKILFDKITDSIDKICIFPFGFPDCRNFLISDIHIRHSIIENYILIYEIRESNKSIAILRFCYSGRDITKLEI